MPFSLLKKNPRLILKQVILILGFLLSTAAQSADQKNTQKNFTIQIDNDILFGTDREYTGGLKLYYNDAHLKLNDQLITPIKSLLGSYFSKSLATSTRRQDQFEFSMEIYTIRQKSNGKTLQSLTNTAWASLSLKRFYQFNTANALPIYYHLGMRLGWIGPSNGGEQIQNGFHHLIGNKSEKGWDKQPFDQPTFQLGFERQSLIYQSPHKTLNAYWTSWGEVGSPRTDLYLGIGGYLQKNAHPIFYHNFPNRPIEHNSDWGYFLFTNISLSYDFYNLMRDGRPFTKDPPLIPQLSPWRLKSHVGLGIQHGAHSFSFTVTRWQQFYAKQPETAFHFASLVYNFAY